jgi:hypothetical protein
MDHSDFEENINGYEYLSASEMALFVLSDPYPKYSGPSHFDVVWDDTLQDDTAIGTFEVWSVLAVHVDRQHSSSFPF